MSVATGPAIQVEGLRKEYRRRGRRRLALDGLDLLVAPGQVHGFLGPNGSGKTTTLRALLGQAASDAGTMRIFGHRVPQHLPKVIRRVGAVVEAPRFFGNFTARKTLRLLATTGGVKRRRVDEVLEIVGLKDRAKDRVRSYSLGMMQRLAVASALLKSPDLLILDEPANGLDPAGIRQMRDLLRSLRDTGTTVLLSSHILSEVQQICDTVTIISMGRRVVTGPVGEVLSQFDKGDVRVKVADLDAAVKLMRDAGLPVRVADDHMVVSDLADPAWITETLAKHRMYVSELTPLLPNLENVFLDLTGTTPVAGTHLQVDDAYRPALDAAVIVLDPPDAAAASGSDGSAGTVVVEHHGSPRPAAAASSPEPAKAAPDGSATAAPDGSATAAPDGSAEATGAPGNGTPKPAEVSRPPEAAAGGDAPDTAGGSGPEATADRPQTAAEPQPVATDGAAVAATDGSGSDTGDGGRETTR